MLADGRRKPSDIVGDDSGQPIVELVDARTGGVCWRGGENSDGSP
jgi:hypothetical protein